MVSIGMRLEEGLREGRLIKESIPAGGSKKKDYEVNMVKGQPRHDCIPTNSSPRLHPFRSTVNKPNQSQNLDQT